MASVVETLTLIRIIAILLFLSSLWLGRIILKNDKRHFIQSVVLFLFVLFVMIFINQKNAGGLTLPGLWGRIFPQTALDLHYREVADTGSDNHITAYYFEKPQPRLSVSLDASGRYLNLNNPKSLNRVLSALGLPEVTEGAKELRAVTGSQLHATLYRWDKYPLGTLIVERSLYQNKETLETYHCIANIRILRPY
jgi:hypothetical protein